MPGFWQQVRAPAALVWLGVMTALGLGLCALALFNVPGYENALALALPAAIVGADLGRRVVNRARRSRRSARSTPRRAKSGCAW